MGIPRRHGGGSASQAQGLGHSRSEGGKLTEPCGAGARDILHIASVWLSFWAQSPGFVSHPPLNVPSSLLLLDWVSGWLRMCTSACEL